MVRGVVNARLEAIVNLTVRGPLGQTREIEVVVDTGFTDFLTLPREIVSALGLTFFGVLTGVLANGMEEDFQFFNVEVMWDGRARQVRALASDARPLVGMAMLNGYSLYVEVVEGGQVEILRRE